MTTILLGEILVERQFIGREDLINALRRQEKYAKISGLKKIGEILVEFGKITAIQLLEALRIQVSRAIFIRELLFLTYGVRRKVCLLNVQFDNLTQAELLDKLKVGVCFTPNVDHLMKLQKDREFLAAYESADYRVCDSQILLFASYFLRTPLREKISGSDFFPAFLHHHRNNLDTKVFLLGGAEGVPQLAQKNINTQIGRDIVIGAHSPSYGFENDENECLEIIERINRCKPTVLAVGVGAPKQEKWIVRYRHMMPSVKIFLAVGATIDFQAGRTKRAPQWVSKIGFEWLFRVACEPRRLWRRYVVEDFPCLWLLLMQKLGIYVSPFKGLAVRK